MKYFSVLITILILGLLFSCKKKEEPNNEYRLTSEDISWNIYHVGDTIKFLSNQLRHRIYCVESLNQEIVEVAEFENYTFEEIIIRLKRVDTIMPNAFFSIDFVRGYPGDPQRGFWVMVQWENDLDLGLFVLPEQPNIDTLKVNNILYENIYSFSNSNYTVYYQKQKGWLRIKNNTGETWDRIN